MLKDFEPGCVQICADCFSVLKTCSMCLIGQRKDDDWESGTGIGIGTGTGAGTGTGTRGLGVWESRTWVRVGGLRGLPSNARQIDKASDKVRRLCLSLTVRSLLLE